MASTPPSSSKRRRASLDKGVRTSIARCAETMVEARDEEDIEVITKALRANRSLIMSTKAFALGEESQDYFPRGIRIGM